MRAKLEDGSIVELEDECHGVPRWLWLNDFDHEQNRVLLVTANAAKDRSEHMTASIYFEAFGRAELRRLAEKKQEMQKRKIVEIYRD